jgi:hypothetical protein
MPDAEPANDIPRILVVGGLSRKAGKTSVIESILYAFSGYLWTAVKISSHLHDSPRGGKLLTRGLIWEQSAERGAKVGPADFRLWEETASNSATDTGRFLAAGASRALLLEVDDTHLADAVVNLLELLRNVRVGWVICETTRAAPLLGAPLFLMVVGRHVRVAKTSAQRVGARADGIVVFAPAGNSVVVHSAAVSVGMPGDSRNAVRREGNWDNLTSGPVFRMQGGGHLPADLHSFIERRFLG